MYDKIVIYYYFMSFKEKILSDCEEKTNSKIRMNVKPRLLLILMHVYWTAYSGASNFSEHLPVMCSHFQ